MRLATMPAVVESVSGACAPQRADADADPGVANAAGTGAELPAPVRAGTRELLVPSAAAPQAPSASATVTAVATCIVRRACIDLYATRKSPGRSPVDAP